MERSYWSSPERVYLLVSAINELSIAFTFSTYVLFLEDLGLTRLEVNLVNVAFYLGRFFLEVPTGVIADYCGRKVSCVTAFALYAVGTVMYWQSATFGWCIASELTLAVGSTCLSGAFNAWIKYEMKLRGKHEGDIHALSARKAGYNQLAVMIGAPLGGLAAWCFSTATPFLMSAIGEAVTMILAILLMREARVVVRSGKTWSDLWSTASRGLKYSYESVPVRRMMIVSAVVTLGLMAPNMQWAPTFKPYVGKGIGTGLLFTGVGILLWCGARLVPRLLLRTRNEHWSLAITLAGMGLGIAVVGMGGFPMTLAGFGLYEFAYGMYKPLKEATLNNVIDSDDHATIQSFDEMAAKIAGAIGLLITGALAEFVSRESAWVFGGAACCVAAFLAFRSKK